MKGKTMKTTFTITVPESFGMFSKEGNKVLINLAKKLLNNMLKNPKEWRKHFGWYIKDYNTLCEFNSHKEISDTDVREQVYGFLFQLSDATSSSVEDRKEKANFLAEYRK
jgi:hypothetical protein